MTWGLPAICAVAHAVAARACRRRRRHRRAVNPCRAMHAALLRSQQRCRGRRHRSAPPTRPRLLRRRRTPKIAKDVCAVWHQSPCMDAECSWLSEQSQRTELAAGRPARLLSLQHSHAKESLHLQLQWRGTSSCRWMDLLAIDSEWFPHQVAAAKGRQAECHLPAR